MTEPKPGSEFHGSLSAAREPDADRRSDLPDSADVDPDTSEGDLHDISKILLGAQASTGKATFAAGRMTVGDAEAQRHAMHEQQKRQEQEAQERANLARWNAQMTMVGGIQMTNAQAQRARQNVIENDEEYADWAVRKGLISEDQKDEFKAGVRLKNELEDKRGRGTLTTADAEREAQLDRSDAGRAIDAATAYSYQNKGLAPSAEAKKSDATATMAGTVDVLDRAGLFQSAPDASTAFQVASSPETERKPVSAASPSPSIRATGLDL